MSEQSQQNTTRAQVISGFLWRFAERIASQLVQFIVSVVLARVLLPEEFGTIALVLVFTQILQVFVDSGMGAALIQKKDADALDFSTVFYFNLVWCSLTYLVAFFAAPAIAAFYDNPSLTLITRVLATTVLISGLRNIQQAYVSRALQFRRFFWSTLSATLISGVVGIAMALVGYGVWALVAQQVLNVAIATLVLWFTVAWRPIWAFSFERLWSLVSYGWKLLVSALIDALYNNIRQLFIGKLYTETDLAFYNRGQQVPNLIVVNVNTSIDSVLLPVMSQEQDSAERVRAMCRRSMTISTYIMAPLMMGLAFCAEPLVSLVFTDKWLPCVPYLRIFCITYMFYPLHTANLNAIKAMGRSDLFLKLEIAKNLIGFALLLATMHISVMAMAYSMIVNSVASQIINSWPNRTLLNYRYSEQLGDILPAIALAVSMGVVVYPLSLLPLPSLVIVLIQFLGGATFYLVGSIICKFESYTYIKNVALSFLGNKQSATKDKA